ncbi:MAG: chorismate synthase [Nitrososphaerota archaeon]|nr:chorismate synthase [Candidatus Bathyarchaeota archaeon]MDW8022294.1 chorismate synthase [Nitrososphaerota archaeon]
MAGNSIGKSFVVTCFGESHGKCVGVVVDGCPAGLPLSEKDIQVELDKRIPPKLEIVSARIEKDVVEILSGVFEDFTTGAPICALVWNKEAEPSDYEDIKDTPRPSHADYAARIKYGGFNDYRGGGRFSGRITVALVMAGAIAKKLLKLFGVEVLAYTKAIGNVKLYKTPELDEIRRNTYLSAVRCPDPACSKSMEEVILKARREGDSLGGIVECVAVNVPVGVGDPIFDSLDADIAKMLFNVPAVKGVEFGVGFKAAQLKGSENNDAYVIREGRVVTLTNNAGGVLGGLSTGMPITIRVAIKPTPSIPKEQKTVNLASMKETTIRVGGRHDPCIVPKAVPVLESALAIVLADHMLREGIIPKVLRRGGGNIG